MHSIMSSHWGGIHGNAPWGGCSPWGRARACVDQVMWSHKMATSVLGCEEWIRATSNPQRALQPPVRIYSSYPIISHHTAHAFSSARCSVAAVGLGGNQSLARQQLVTSLMQDSYTGQFIKTLRLLNISHIISLIPYGIIVDVKI